MAKFCRGCGCSACVCGVGLFAQAKRAGLPVGQLRADDLAEHLADRVLELEAALEAARVAVDALPFDAHEINCESLNPDPDCDGWCDCNVMSRIEKVRLALGLEVNNG